MGGVEVLHAIRWEFSDGWVTPTAVCYAAPDADCRLTGRCDCERWGEIQRRDDGTIWHHIEDYGDSYEPVWHQVEPMEDDCNVCLFINESGCVDELATKGTSFLIGEHPISPVWMDEGCDWELARQVTE